MSGVTYLWFIILFLLTDQILCSNNRKDLYCGGVTKYRLVCLHYDMNSFCMTTTTRNPCKNYQDKQTEILGGNFGLSGRKKRLTHIMHKVESFRIDSHGNQRSKTIPYARSETHLVEILENVCERMNNYAESTDKETGRKRYIRTSSRTGESVTLENISMSGDIAKDLKFACESLIEDHEDVIVDIFKQEREDAVEELCRKQTGLCENDTIKEDHNEL